MNKIIAKVASLVIVLQNSYIFLFSIKEGVSVYSFLSLVPAMIGLIVLWSTYTFSKRYKYQTLILLFFAILIIVVIEFLLPISPIKTTYESKIQQEAINSTIVRDVTDELSFSENNNPIGIRIKYSVQFPADGIYSVYPSIFNRKDKYPEPYQVQLGQSTNVIIEPEPTEIEDRPGSKWFRANTIYNFTIDSEPMFLVFVNGSKKTPCINLQPNNKFTETDFKNWLDKNIGTQYETSIEIGNDSYFTNRVLGKDFVTNYSYNIKDFYLSALKEGAKQCNF